MRLASVLTASLLVASCLQAMPLPDDPFGCPAIADFDYWHLTDSDFNDDELPADQKLRFQEARAKIGYTICACPCTGLQPALSYTYTHFDWKNSPFFTQENYPEVELMLNSFTLLVPNWYIRGGLGVGIQTSDHFNIGRYGVVRGYAWGRTAWSACLGWHVGVLFERGLKNTFVFPILGLDYQVNRRLKINAIFPLDGSVELTVVPQLKVAAAIRWQRTRRRAGPSNPLSEGIWEFRTWGAEGRIKWCPIKCGGIELFAGSTVYGWVRIDDPGGGHLSFHTVSGAPYAGLEGYLSF